MAPRVGTQGGGRENSRLHPQERSCKRNQPCPTLVSAVGISVSSGTVRVPLYKLYRLWGFAMGGGTTHKGGCVNDHPQTCLLEITRHTPCPHSFESGTQERLSWRVWLWVLVKTESCCRLGASSGGWTGPGGPLLGVPALTCGAGRSVLVGRSASLRCSPSAAASIPQVSDPREASEPGDRRHTLSLQFPPSHAG